MEVGYRIGPCVRREIEEVLQADVSQACNTVLDFKLRSGPSWRSSIAKSDKIQGQPGIRIRCYWLVPLVVVTSTAPVSERFHNCPY